MGLGRSGAPELQTQDCEDGRIDSIGLAYLPLNPFLGAFIGVVTNPLFLPPPMKPLLPDLPLPLFIPFPAMVNLLVDVDIESSSAIYKDNIH